VGGFAAWLAQRFDAREEAVAPMFTLRTDYAGFLRYGFAAAVAALRAKDVQVLVRREKVSRISAAAQGVRIETGVGFALADGAVLAIGAQRGPLMAGAVSPWGRFHSQGADASAIVIGSGLTAADAVASLQDDGWRGTITCLSGRGLAPLALSDSVLTPAKITAPAPTPSVAGLTRGLIQTFRGAVARGDDWRSAMDALRPSISGLWAALPASTRARLLGSRRLDMWMRHRHRLPAQTAMRLQGLVRAGQLRFAKGRVAGVENGQAVLTDGRKLPAALVIDGRGFDLGYRHDDLVQGLLRGGLTRPCPTGCGFTPDADYRISDSHQLFGIGAVFSGALLETTAAAEIRTQAGVVADALKRAFSPHHR
jgi:uncharacterized NAD(P)/FAD-binding protein YdhS